MATPPTKLEALIRGIAEPLVPQDGQHTTFVWRKQLLEYIKGLFRAVTAENITNSIVNNIKNIFITEGLVLPTPTPPCVLVVQHGQTLAAWVQVPDITKDYILAYDASDTTIKWIETTTSCP